MNIHKSVQVNIDHANLKDRIKINSGSFCFNAASASHETKKKILNFKYLKHSYVPNIDFRSLSNEELKLISEDFTYSKHNSIKIIKFNFDYLDQLIKLGLHDCKTHYELLLFQQKLEFESVYYDFMMSFEPYIEDVSSVRFSPLPFRPVGYLTASTDSRQNNSFVGLHFDTFSQSTFNKRHFAENRLVANIGLETRYLLFINLTVADICEMLNIDIDSTNLSILELQHKFFDRFSDYPVFMLSIEPGEAYIAPTENIIHDGSTYFKQYCDIAAVILGQISCSPIAKVV
ncbi:MAG: hypothetical protein VXX85_06495 [Candidatus Margulisiibacteriota bacterium]|nr:hypothetical protein [Candidatus Margulisiibacteriota bacterium]